MVRESSLNARGGGPRVSFQSRHHFHLRQGARLTSSCEPQLRGVAASLSSVLLRHAADVQASPNQLCPRRNSRDDACYQGLVKRTSSLPVVGMGTMCRPWMRAQLRLRGTKATRCPACLSMRRSRVVAATNLRVQPVPLEQFSVSSLLAVPFQRPKSSLVTEMGISLLMQLLLLAVHGRCGDKRIDINCPTQQHVFGPADHW